MVSSHAAFLLEKLVEIRSPLLTAGPVLVATYTHSEKSSYMVAMETSAQRAHTPCTGVVRRGAVSRVVHVTVEVLRLYS